MYEWKNTLLGTYKIGVQEGTLVTSVIEEKDKTLARLEYEGMDRGIISGAYTPSTQKVEVWDELTPDDFRLLRHRLIIEDSNLPERTREALLKILDEVEEQRNSRSRVSL